MSSRILGVGFALLGLICCLPACPGQQTVNHVSEHLTIDPVIPGGTFIGYSGTSFSQGIPSGKKVTLLSAKLTSSSGEFSWASSLVGTAKQTEGSQIIVEKKSFSPGTSPTDLDIVDKGDLLPLFPDTQDFKIYWYLQFADHPSQSYPSGVTVTFDYELQIE
jgi:hypothetical protein